MRAIVLEAGALACAVATTTAEGVAGALAELSTAAMAGRDRPTIKLVTNIFINTVYASIGKTPRTPVMTDPMA